MDTTTLRATLEVCRRYLDDLPSDAWSADVPLMKDTVRGTVMHIAQCGFWYSVDLSAGTPELPTAEIQLKTDVTPADAVRTLMTAGRLLAATVDGAGPGERGWHPAGNADPAGFAAMGCDELLVHTADIATATGVPFQPPDEVAEATLRRLFPWAPAEVSPWPGLLWANDRVDLPDRPRPGSGWVWHCAPLSEWDGTIPVWG